VFSRTRNCQAVPASKTVSKNRTIHAAGHQGEAIYHEMKANQKRKRRPSTIVECDRPTRGRSRNPVLLIVISLAMAMAAQAQDDKSFFAGAHVGMTIEQCQAYYHRLHIGSLGHSGAPPGEVQVEFRTSSNPQRRVYVYYRKSNGKIVSVTYSKMGDNETFSKDEIQSLTALNQGSGLVTKVSGGDFEVSTPKQLQLEEGQ
jgi:hypothetical protein